MSKKRWTTNLRRVEIEIHTGCNLACPNCDRSAPQARSHEAMEISQVEKFVSESIGLDWDWERITILGGEPSLHHSFAEILSALKVYHLYRESTEFRIYSNGYGPAVSRRLSLVPSWIDVRNTSKDPSHPPLFSTYNVAPIDCADCNGADFSKACAITTWCGLGLTRYGYYPCGAGASLDRVFGFDIGIKSLSAVTPTSVASQITRLCGLCGHFRDFDKREEYVLIRDESILTGWTREQKTSPTWERAYLAYAQKPPQLTLY